MLYSILEREDKIPAHLFMGMHSFALFVTTEFFLRCNNASHHWVGTKGER